MRKTWFVTAWMFVLVVSLAGMAGCRGVSAERMRTAPLALVLEGGRRSRIHVIDLDAGTVLRTIRLRSLALDMAVQPRARRIVTAQCGGIGNDADRRCGIVDLKRGGSCRYVDLGVPNPSFVEVLGDHAVVSLGFEQKEGLVAKVVDVSAASVTRSGHVPPGTGRIRRVGDQLYASVSPRPGVPDSATQLCRVSPNSLEVSRVATVALESFSVTADVERAPDPTVLLVGWRGHSGAQRARSCEVWRIKTTDGRVVGRVAVPGLLGGAEDACAFGDRLAILDVDSVAEKAAPARVVVLDRDLKRQRVIPLESRDAAIAASGTKLLILDAGAGRLLEVSPVSMRVIRDSPIKLIQPAGARLAAME
jgi:hypothetical protein